MVKAKAKVSSGQCDHKRHHAKVLQALRDLSGQVDTLVATKAQQQANREAISKIGPEFTAMIQKVADLEAVLTAGGAITPNIDAALAALKAQVKVVDELVVNAAS